jgi:hypothetical protein
MLKINKKITTAAKLACNLLACGILNASAGGDSEKCDSTSSRSNQPAPVAVSATEGSNPKKRALSNTLQEYAANFAEINKIKENIKKIPADLRDSIEDYKVAQYKQIYANRLLEKLENPLNINRAKILYWMDSLARLPRTEDRDAEVAIIRLYFANKCSALNNPISTISPQMLTTIPKKITEKIIELIQNDENFSLEKVSLEKTLAAANTDKLEAYNTLSEAYNKSHFKRNIDSDLELYDLLFAAKNEFEDFIKNSNLRDLLASSRDMNLALSEKRSIDDIVPKAAKIARTKLENQI